MEPAVLVNLVSAMVVAAVDEEPLAILVNRKHKRKLRHMTIPSKCVPVIWLISHMTS